MSPKASRISKVPRAAALITGFSPNNVDTYMKNSGVPAQLRIVVGVLSGFIGNIGAKY